MNNLDIHKTLIEYSPDLYVLYSDGDFIEFALAGNDFKKFLPVDKIIGKRVSEIMPSPVRELIIKGIDKCKKKDKVIRGHFPINKDGDIRYNEIRFIPQSDGKVLGIISDITDLHEAKKEKKKAKKRLEEHIVLLEDIVFSLSHELREPLRSISGFSSLLRRRWHTFEDQQREEYLLLIEKNAAKMSKQIKALTTILHLPELNRKESVDIHQLMNAIEKELEDIFSGLTSFSIQLEGESDIRSSHSLLYMLLFQLIHNSISFRHPDRTPHIKIKIQESIKFINIKIEDNGQGIEDAYREQIFSLFKQLDYKHKFEGIGVGLTLARRIISTLDGSLEMQSTWDVGTRISIQLPLNEHN